MDIDYDQMPNPNLKDAVRRYIEDGVPMGSFLMCVASNDLAGACGRADVWNRELLFDIVSWFYNHAPSICWGSPEKVDTWINRKQAERAGMNHDYENKT